MAFIRAPKADVTPAQYRNRYVKDTVTGRIYPRSHQLRESYGKSPEAYAKERRELKTTPLPVKRIEAQPPATKALTTRQKHAVAKEIYAVKWANESGISTKQAKRDPMFQAAWSDYLKSYRIKDVQEKKRLRRDMLDYTRMPRNWEYYGPGDTP